jgi:hypothetical protein
LSGAGSHRVSLVARMAEYRFLTNLESPVDLVDGNFLNVLKDYRIGPPQPTKERNTATLTKNGVFGVYTTDEALRAPPVRKLTGFTVATLSDAKL